ncbi:MAG: hypothetical protein COV55_00710 [Candidatus Komeilibacteria bacterium CG11_big_fil_rev_8_21_14_0_20_36_20]|uniref:Uncharacterized protein n=1 Tax=Candidatus Komeilibacteria bacterium CG11_big_fil_rev_8_21_14_0_20_36_20 TaxID=1974477 RepID=A0A2H0NDF7_9BACT|nr:MAG: hypothetical protein COV55_00710 [Candidatus Komeilibacteria bacterium CG11_big_fil_rev_8_21_14_0_20_36_20]PIR81303.1 MAG: hypothetical protein COU21_03680 [Candidatus Komeilibacteria bacterium CG10_big_fil_rev_8_21_14_0_10_36_65]PJC54933.1 MAG: hypothetical protein CO027_04350 [Candidatus Komeilibacteria bacterium CG_4_9_14_0_2_um_filter_36_13]
MEHLLPKEVPTVGTVIGLGYEFASEQYIYESTVIRTGEIIQNPETENEKIRYSILLADQKHECFYQDGKWSVTIIGLKGSYPATVTIQTK